MPAKITDRRLIGQTAREILSAQFPDWTDEELLFHPDDAKDLCRRTRGKLARRLEDHEILRALVGIRKNG